MAKSLALRRATKSIPLSGGISEDAQDMLLEPPGMANITNARFPVLDSALKCLPPEDGLNTAASNYIGATESYGPIQAWSRNNSIAVFGKDEVSQFSKGQANWTPKNFSSDMMGIEQVFNTNTIHGGTCGDWCPLASAGYNAATAPDTWTWDGYVVVYDQKNLGANGAVFCNTYIQDYDLSGKLIFQERFTDVHTPRVRAQHDGSVVMLASNPSGNYVTTTYTRSGGLTTLVQSGSKVIEDVAMEQDTPVGFKPPENKRIAYTHNTRSLNSSLVYDARYDETGAWPGFAGYKLGFGIGAQIRVFRVDINGGSDTEQTVFTDTVNVVYRLLDVCCGPSGENHILVGAYDLTTGISDIWIVSFDRTTNVSVASYVHTPTFGYGAVNGSLDIEPISGNIFAAVTMDDAWQTTWSSDGSFAAVGGINNGVYWFTTNASTTAVVNTGFVYNHRLVSKVRFDELQRPHGVVQQWANWNPTPGNAATPVEEPTTPVTALKGVTSVLIQFTDKYTNFGGNQDQNIPVAAYDAGASRHMDEAVCGLNTFLSNLYFLDQLNDDGSNGYWDYLSDGTYRREHQWMYLNRYQETFMDYGYWVHRNPSAGGYDARGLRSFSDARFNLFRVSPDIPVYKADYKTGCFLGAGIPLWYDGGTLGEASPLDQPEFVQFEFIGSPTTTGETLTYDSVTSNDIVLTVVIGYYDDAGTFHRSAPSNPLFVGDAALAGGPTGSSQVSCVVSMPLTVFRDRNYVAQLFYNLPDETPRLLREIEYDPSTFTPIVFPAAETIDNPLGTNLQDVKLNSAPLYTEGNVLAADTWPAVDTLAITARRIFAAAANAPGDVYYSKLFESGVAPEFSASLIISVGQGRKITALGAVDDKVICFFEDGITIIYGAGPDNTGANGDFTTEQLNTIVGCSDPESVVTVPDGIMFYSDNARSFYILTRDLQLQEIGRPIRLQSFSIDVLAAIENPATEEIMFAVRNRGTARPETTPVGDSGSGEKPQPPRSRIDRNLPGSDDRDINLLVYNYEYKKWTARFDADGFSWQKLVLYENKITGINSNFRWFNTGTTWANSPTMTWETPWIKVNQLQDFGRFYGADFLGKYLSSWKDNGSGLESGDLQITVKYDYEEDPDADVSVFRFRANQDFDPSAGDRLQFRVRPKRQKCQAVKFLIEEIATEKIELSEPDYTTGEGFELVACDLHYGAKGGSGDKNLGTLRRKG